VGETLDCAIVWTMKGGGRVPEQGGCLQIIVLILVQRPRTKQISCKGQCAARRGLFLSLRCLDVHGVRGEGFFPGASPYVPGSVG